jgi:hydrogenase maturation protein HypF
MEKTPAGVISARFHSGLSKAIGTLVKKLTYKDEKCFISTVALSGGVFQNRILLEQVTKILQQEDYQVLTHRRVPANDGGISLGQAVVAAARGMNKEQS